MFLLNFFEFSISEIVVIMSGCKQRYDSGSIQAVAEAKENYLSWQRPVCQMETNRVIVY